MNLDMNKVSSFYYNFLIAEFSIVGSVASFLLFSSSVLIYFLFQYSLVVSLCKGAYVK
jgi:hypothetical protein